MLSRHRSAKGSVLVFSLLILSILLVTSLTIFSSAILDQKASLSTGSSTRSFQVADSGVEEVLFQIYRAHHPTLNDLAAALGSACTVSGTTPQVKFPSAGGDVTVSFYEDTNQAFPYSGGCAGTDWRTKVVGIKSEGSSGTTARAIGAKIDCSPFLDSETAEASGIIAEAQGLALDGTYAYVAGAGPSAARGLYVFDVSNRSNLSQIGFLPTQSGPAEISGFNDDVLGVSVSGDYAYLATYFGGMVIADIATPSSPSYAGKVDLPGETWAVEIEGDHAYTATREGLFAIDIRDKTNPTISGNMSFSSSPSGTVSNDIALYDPDGNGSSDYAYVALRTGGVGTVNITDPTNPTEENRITSGFASNLWAYDVAVYDDSSGTDYLYVVRHPTDTSVATQGGILVYSLADPSAPSHVKTISISPSQLKAPRTVSVDNGRLRVGGGPSETISNYNLIPTASDPVFLNRFNEPGADFWKISSTSISGLGTIFAVGGDKGLYSFSACDI